MSQPLTLFWPVFPQRSDGRTVVNNKGAPVRNGPTESQLDRTPNEQGQSDYYRLIDKDDAKHVDWRKKLGGMLVREIGRAEDEDKWQQCILWDFPEGYRLYEHIKSKTNGESKNHSGGGHDRQDAYLYGYPKGYVYPVHRACDGTRHHLSTAFRLASSALKLCLLVLTLQADPGSAFGALSSSSPIYYGSSPTSRATTTTAPAAYVRLTRSKLRSPPSQHDPQMAHQMSH